MSDMTFNAERKQLLHAFAENIRRLREQSGFSQEAFADEARMHRTSIGYFEQARREPNLSTLLILSDSLGVSLDKLVEGLPVPQERRPARQRKGPKLT
ncbi:MAG TPA: helix-turn-helix transcriptional regulator [Solirubrobacteraceae bacterium]